MTMPNPFSILNPSNPMRGYDFNAIQQLYRNMGNPMQLLNQAVKSNPQMRPIMDALNRGANPQQMFYSLCQQRGINPQEFLRNITGNNGF